VKIIQSLQSSFLRYTCKQVIVYFLDIVNFNIIWYCQNKVIWVILSLNTLFALLHLYTHLPHQCCLAESPHICSCLIKLLLSLRWCLQTDIIYEFISWHIPFQKTTVPCEGESVIWSAYLGSFSSWEVFVMIVNHAFTQPRATLTETLQSIIVSLYLGTFLICTFLRYLTLRQPHMIDVKAPTWRTTLVLVHVQ